MISGVSKWNYNNDKRSRLTDITAISKFSSSIKNTVKYVFLNNNSFSSIESLGDFKKIYELDVMCNSKLLSLNGLENHTNLVYVFAQKCNLQNINGLENTPELFGLCILSNINLKSMNGIENSKKIDHIEAGGCDIIELSALQDNSKVRYLALQYNVNLESIIALKNCTGLRKLFLEGNINMIGAEVRDALADPTTHVLQNCGATYSIPSKYNIYFTTLTSYNYSNLGLTDDSDEINSLKNKTNVTRLNLSGNPNLSNDKLQEILSTMTGVKYLSLNGCIQLESIDFINQGKMTGLVELDLRNTSDSLVDLSNLNDYAKNLRTLVLSNYNVDMNKIQTTINRFGDDDYSGIDDSWIGKYYWSARGLMLQGNLSNYSFKNCTSITKFRSGSEHNFMTTGILDLSGCTNLKELKSYAWGKSYKLPINLEIFLVRGDCTVDLSLCENLISIYVDDQPENNFNKMIKTLNSKAKVNSISIFKRGVTDLSFLLDLDTSKLTKLTLTGDQSGSQPNYIKSLKGINKAKNLQTFGVTSAIKFTDIAEINECDSITNIYFNDCPNLVNFSNISNLKNVKSLQITNTKVAVIEGLSELSNIESLNLHDNQLSDISFIKNLKNISGKLELYNNNINDLSPLEENIENGKIKYSVLSLNNNIIQTTTVGGHNNVETLKKLYNAGLRTLDISKNNFTAGSTDELKNLKWTSYKE